MSTTYQVGHYDGVISIQFLRSAQSELEAPRWLPGRLIETVSLEEEVLQLELRLHALTAGACGDVGETQVVQILLGSHWRDHPVVRRVHAQCEQRLARQSVKEG